MSKSVIFCADGTWNSPQEKDENIVSPTNVRKLYEILVDEPLTQVTYYDDGIGADGLEVTKLLEGGTGAGLDHKIMDGYQFLMNEWKEGDRIYLFGFSRGAYTVRSLGEMVAECGLLPLLAGEDPVAERARIQAAYDTYRQNNNSTALAFRQKNQCRELTIQMIGVWDTVGALGLPLELFPRLNQALFNFHTTALANSILFGYQALAIDEERRRFVPSLWDSREGIEQVWFAGSHSDVGGGYVEHGLSDLALRWMIEKASAKGVRILSSALTVDNMPVVMGSPYDVMHAPWEKLPFVLLPKAKRQIPENSEIHISVQQRMNDKSLNYAPSNLPLQKIFVS